MMLGNLSIEDMETELGVEFPEPFRTDFAQKQQQRADDILPGRWHCFRFPLVLVCGDEEIQRIAAEALTPLGPHMKAEIKIGVQGQS